MRLLWTLFKVLVACVVLAPVAIIVLAVSLGVLGALLGLAIFALKLVIAGLLVYGAFRVGASLLRGSRPKAQPRMPELVPVDPYYEAAKRELDRELGDVRP